MVLLLSCKAMDSLIVDKVERYIKVYYFLEIHLSETQATTTTTTITTSNNLSNFLNHLLNFQFSTFKMKFSEIITLSAALATSASATPLKRSAGHENVDITFIGAADAQFTESFPTDGSSIDISKTDHHHHHIVL